MLHEGYTTQKVLYIEDRTWWNIKLFMLVFPLLILYYKHALKQEISFGYNDLLSE